MTDETPRPNINSRRWLMAGVLMFLVTIGMALTELKRALQRARWIEEVEGAGVQVVVGIYTPPRDSGAMAEAATLLFRLLGRNEVRAILWTQEDVRHLIDAPRPFPKDTVVYYVETLGSSTGTRLGEQLPEAEIRAMSAD